MKYQSVLVAMLVSRILCTVCLAEVTPAAIFGDHMVLQRDKPVPVWGTAEAGTQVTVEFADQKKTAKADKDGNWRVTLDPMKASAEGQVLKIGGKEFSDVLVGEVWLGSGQSNMDSPIGWVNYGKTLEKARGLANKSTIRYYGMPGYPYFKGSFAYDGKPVAPPADRTWTVLDPGTSLYCSAVLFFFAVRLQEELGVPIGILNRAVGATSCGYWLPAESLTNDPDAKKDQDRYRAHAAIAAKGMFYGVRRGHTPSAANSKGNTPLPMRHGQGYAERILPLQSFAVRGLCWDQGEAGPGAPVEPPTALAALIRSWRRAWECDAKDWPVLVIQKPQGYGLMGDAKLPSPLPTMPRIDVGPLQEHQWWGWDAYKGDGWSYWQVCEREPNVHIVNSMDLDNDTHPVDKDQYGCRLADLALARVYGRQATNESPRFASMKAEGDRLIVRFTHVGEGLKIFAGTEVLGFRVAGDDRIFFDAVAEITDKDTVVLSSKQVPKPVVALYGVHTRTEKFPAMRQATAGLGNLCSSHGLQAFPFRSSPWAPPTIEGMDRAADQLIALLDDGAMRLEAARSLSEIGAKGEEAVAKLETLVRAEVPDYGSLMGILLVYATRDPTGSVAARARQVLLRRVVDETLDDAKRARAADYLRNVGAEGMDIVPALRHAIKPDSPNAKFFEAAIDKIEGAAGKRRR